MKRYIVTDTQLQKLKTLLENDTFGSYWSEEVRELRYLVEDIEAQEIAPEEIAKVHIIYDKWEGKE